MDKTNLAIGDLAKATGTKVVTIRYYEQAGLLPAPRRTASNYRAYDTGHLQRLRFIRRCRDLGFSVDQVRELLAMTENGDRDCCTIDQIARAHLKTVRQKIVDLSRLASELDRISSQCRGGTVAECRIIEALSP